GVLDIEGLARESVTAPPSLGRLHSGYAPQDGTTSGGYYSGFITIPGITLQAPRNGSAPSRVIFVADANARLPAVSLAMRDAGLAVIVSDVLLGEGNFASTRTLPLDAHHRVRLRMSQLLAGDFRADIVDAHPLEA